MSLFFHTDDPIVIPTSEGAVRTTVLEGFEPGDYVGSPLYAVVDEHTFAALLVVIAPLLIWLSMITVRRLAARDGRRASAVVAAFSGASLTRRVAAVAVWYSALLHAVLVFTHEPSGYTVLYAVGALALALAGWWIAKNVRPRLSVSIVVSSIAAFWVLGAPADQLGMVTKLLEILALAMLAVPAASSSRWRRMAPVGVVSLVAVTALAGFVGAFVTVGADGGHHGGEYPAPGTLVPYIERLEPTPEESHFASDLHADLVVATERYRDPAVAEQAGYQVGVIRGSDHHAQNPALIGDGRILDPSYPESLIYAESPYGPVLVGVMFEMDGFNGRGPTNGGPIMLWHAHENICFGLLPMTIAGLESPFGNCPVGSINVPQTGEMLHAWIVPGVPVEDQWGHVDEEWLAEYLELHGEHLAAAGQG